MEAFRIEVYVPLTQTFKREFGHGIPDIRDFRFIPNVSRYLERVGMELPPRGKWAEIRSAIEFMIQDEAERLRGQGEVLPSEPPDVPQVVALEGLTNLSPEDFQEIFEAVTKGETETFYPPKIVSPDGTKSMLFWTAGDGVHLIIGVESNWAPLEELSGLLASMGVSVSPRELEAIVPRNYDKRPGTNTRLAYHVETPEELSRAMADAERDFEKQDTEAWDAFLKKAKKL